MIPYLIIFFFISLFSLSSITLETQLKKIIKIIFLIFLTIFIGLRHEVGGDWNTYIYDFRHNVEFFNLLKFEYVRDFGYEFLSYFLYHLGLNIYALNFILAIIFVYSLNNFSYNFENNYSLLFLIALPYIITVVAMGYSRQAIGLAFMLIAISQIKNQRIFLYILFTILALIFHKSSAILIPFIFFSFYNLKLNVAIAFIMLSLIALLLIIPEMNRIYAGYMSENLQYESKGVYYRIALNIFAGLLFILFFSKLKLDNGLNKLIIFIFLANLLLLFYINDYKTLVDRIIIYFSIIQLIVFSRVYLIFPKIGILFNSSVVILYGILYLIWLNYSFYSYAWIPYRNILLPLF